MKIFLVFISLLILTGCSNSNNMVEEINLDSTGYEIATFSGGCFWCSEKDLEKVEGVVEVISGYTGGDEINPSYEDVASGNTGHREAVRVVYDPKNITYGQLLDAFWRHIDPTDADGQFVDRGFQYSSAIWYHDNEQKKLAEESKQKIESSNIFNESIKTDILPVKEFYFADDYHQDYYKKNPLVYNFYRKNSGRDQFIQEYWN